jgi:hypothetical protein
MCFLCSLPQPSYCERTSSGIFSEPLNLLSNLFFFGAAWFAWLKLRSSKVIHEKYLRFLVIMIAVVGGGSALFHALPNKVTLLLDAVPIYIFLLSALIFLIQHLARSWKWAVGLTSIFAATLIIATVYVPTSFANGSIRHLITFTTLAILLIWCFRRFGRISAGLIPVLGIYGLAITMRSIDQAACTTLPTGTHFVWHILNAVASYFVIVFLIRIDTKDPKIAA